MHLLRFDDAASAAAEIQDADVLQVNLVTSAAFYDEEGEIVTPREVLPGYWLLTAEQNLPGEVATIDGSSVISTTDDSILGATLDLVFAGMPAEPLTMAETVLTPDPVLPPLTARRLRLGLVAHGIVTESVTAAIAGIADEAERRVAMIEWEYATEFDRDHPLIAEVGGALGLTSEQIDAMWVASASL